jgi:DNA-binding MarR family transcriptional regulator
MREVANLLAMDRTTLTANLKPLERRGLVEVAPDPADRRGRLLVLTDGGRGLLAEAMPLWRSAQESLGASIASGGRDVLLADLRALS